MNKYRIIALFTAVLLALAFIVVAIKFTFSFKYLYYFDINYLNLTDISNLSKETLKENYTILIDYLLNIKVTELHLPNFKMSTEGRVHFEDVKLLIEKFYILFWISFPLGLLGAFYLFKKKDLKFIKYTSFALLIIPILLAIPALINFDHTFDTFHELFFRNDYYLFDPSTDPIINVLPQTFFFHSALFMLLTVILESIMLFVLYNFLKKKIESNSK